MLFLTIFGHVKASLLVVSSVRWYNSREVIAMRDVGKNIKQIRLSKNMTQDSLADALYVTRQTVSNYENGRSRPDLDMLVRIAEIFDTDVNTLIYGPPVPESKKAAYKRLAISVFLLLLTGGLYLIINIIISDYLPHNYYQTCILNQ